jgi:hypothetical protein
MARHPHRAKVLSINGERLKSIGYQEAYAMIESGEAVRISRLKAPLAIKLKAPRKTDPLKESQITLAEMEANAGLRGDRCRSKRPDRIGNFVDRAMTKIEIWPDIGDTKAVRVGCRRA